MVWLNVDFPFKTCTLHRQGCSRRPSKEPVYKGFGTLKRDGGWLTFKSDSDALSYYQTTWQGQRYRLIRCSYCRV